MRPQGIPSQETASRPTRIKSPTVEGLDAPIFTLHREPPCMARANRAVRKSSPGQGLQRHSRLLMPALPGIVCKQAGWRVFKRFPEFLGGHVSPGDGQILRRAICRQVCPRCNEPLQSLFRPVIPRHFSRDSQKLGRIGNSKRHNSIPPGTQTAPRTEEGQLRGINLLGPGESDLASYLPTPIPCANRVPLPRRDHPGVFRRPHYKLTQANRWTGCLCSDR